MATLEMKEGDEKSQVKASVKTNSSIMNSHQDSFKEMNSPTQKLIQLKKMTERPPGCSFLGSQPTTAKVALTHLDGPKVDIIVDSGSDITLISGKTLSLFPEPPKLRQGKQITLSQVTAKSTIDDYVEIP